MITNIEIRRRLNKLANELFPNLHLDFVLGNQQTTELIGYIRLMNSVCLNNLEASIECSADKLATKYLLKERVREALVDARDFIQKEINKLD